MSDFGSAVGGLLTASANIYSTERTNAANRQLAELSNQWSIEQWNRENAYNTPAMQVQRLRDAGLNPNLVFAQGNLMNEAAQSPAVTSAAGTQRAWQIDPLTAAQIANLDAQTEKTKSETELTSIQSKISEIDRKLKDMNFDAFEQAYDQGLVHQAVSAGFGSIINSYRGSQFQLFTAAWDFAVMTGMSIEDAMQSSANPPLTLDDLWTPGVGAFSYSKDSIDRARSLFSSSQEAQTEANHAAKLVASLQQQQKRKDFDIYKALNETARFGKTSLERSAAKIALLGLFIAEQRLSLPAFNLSISGGEKVQSKNFFIGGTQ